MIELQDSPTDQSSVPSGRQRSQLQEQEPARIDKTGEKDQTATLSQQEQRRQQDGGMRRLLSLFHLLPQDPQQQRQQDGVMPPIEEMAENEAKAIHLSAQKWQRFNDVMLAHTAQLQAEVSRNYRLGVIFRVSIIMLSASVTVISAMVGDNQRYIAIIVGGVLTALAGIEAYFQFNRRESEAKRQQREVEALRYKMRHQWVTTVQMETDVKRRFHSATKFLQEGQETYNVILNNYALKRDKKNPVPQ